MTPFIGNLRVNDNEIVAFKKVWCKYKMVAKGPFRRLEKMKKRMS